MDVHIATIDCDNPYKKLKSDCSKINHEFELVIQLYDAIEGLGKILKWLKNSSPQSTHAAVEDKIDQYCALSSIADRSPFRLSQELESKVDNLGLELSAL